MNCDNNKDVLDTSLFIDNEEWGFYVDIESRVEEVTIFVPTNTTQNEDYEEKGHDLLYISGVVSMSFAVLVTLMLL